MPYRLQLLYIGREYPCNGKDFVKLKDDSEKDGYGFVVACMSHPWCCYTRDSLPDELPPLVEQDLQLLPGNKSKDFVAKISPWIDVDSDDDRLRRLSEIALRKELFYFRFVNLSYVALELTGAYNHTNLAKIVCEFIERFGNGPALENRIGEPWFWIYVPLFISNDQADCGDTWEWFYSFRTLCNNKVDRLKIVLRLTQHTPEHVDASSTLFDRWYGEPVRVIAVDTSLFVVKENSTTTVSLPILYETLIKRFFNLNIEILITGPTSTVTLSSNNLDAAFGKNLSGAYLAYFTKLFQEKTPLPLGWHPIWDDADYVLYVPVEPLVDSLVCNMYSSFQLDNRKYELYFEAMVSAIDRSLLRHNRKITIMVLGAGRGPLVQQAILALEKMKVKNYKIYAVEKNPNVISTLNRLAETVWPSKKVTVVNLHFDNFRVPENEKADIVVSELLGGFSDNELSPECLDGALHLMLNPGQYIHCISIPESYASYVVPVCDPRAFCQLVDVKPSAKEFWKVYETHWAVTQDNVFMVDKPKPLFEFKHPNFALTKNDRYKQLTFTPTETCDLHGLFGYFKARLLDSVYLSTVPDDHTTGLFSWCPIYFPFKNPVYVKKGEKIVLNFWRCSDKYNVWYEWCLTKPVITGISNKNGRASVLRKM